MIDVLRHPETDHALSFAPLMLSWVHFFVPHPVHRGRYLEESPVHSTVADFYFDMCATDPTGMERLHKELIWVLPKKSAKSMHGAAIVLATALGPTKPVGIAKGGESFRQGNFVYEYTPGEVMADVQPAATQRVMATTKDQAEDTCFNYLWLWCGGAGTDSNYSERLVETFGISQRAHVGKTKFTSPLGGVTKVMAADQADDAADGGREVMAVFEEGHRLKGPVKKTAETIRKNIIAMNGVTFCPTTAHALGEDSYLEDTLKLRDDIRAGLSPKRNLLVHHAFPTPEKYDLTEYDGIKAALDEVYVSAPWRNSDDLAAEFFDRRADINDLKRLYLGIPCSPTYRWLDGETIQEMTCSPVIPDNGATITLGLDASRGVGVTSQWLADATCLMGCAVPETPGDPYVIFPVKLWIPRDVRWELPHDDVDNAVHAAFARWNVAGFFADPPMIEGHVASWEKRYGRRLKAKAQSRVKPIGWWTNRPREMTDAVAEYEQALLEGDVKISNDAIVVDHHQNAHRRVTRTGYVIGKERHKSNAKIDAAISSILAFMAAKQAVRNGAGTRRKSTVTAAAF